MRSLLCKFPWPVPGVRVALPMCLLQEISFQEMMAKPCRATYRQSIKMAIAATLQRLPTAETRLHQLLQCLPCSIVFASQLHHLLPGFSSFLPHTTLRYEFNVQYIIVSMVSWQLFLPSFPRQVFQHSISLFNVCDGTVTQGARRKLRY